MVWITPQANNDCMMARLTWMRVAYNEALENKSIRMTWPEKDPLLIPAEVRDVEEK